MIGFSVPDFLKLAFAVVTLVSQTAFAAPVNIAGALTASDPVFRRPLTATSLSSAETSVAYDVFAFHVSAVGNYSFEANSFSAVGSDTFVYFYQNAFNAASPLVNLIALDDDSGAGALSLVVSPLQAGIQYFLVFASYYNGDFGSYSGVFNTTSGNGQVLLGSLAADVPEPASIALLGLALASMSAWRRRTS